MRGIETYRAVGGRAEAAAAVRGGVAVASPYTIEVRFLGGLTAAQMSAFRTAADRWTRIITGDLPSVQVEGERIDDVVILAQGLEIDGPGGVLGQAGPTHLRPPRAGAAAGLPARGIMSFDTADLADMESEGTLNDVITHEMGHVLGIGTLWSRKRLIRGSGTVNPVFMGRSAMREYGTLRGDGPTPVPVENTGGEGTREGHWRETIFRNELMSGFISQPNNPISRVTAASLGDLGYQVDLNAAEPWELPDLFALAERGALIAERPGIDLGHVLTNIPVELPDDSLAP